MFIKIGVSWKYAKNFKNVFGKVQLLISLLKTDFRYLLDEMEKAEKLSFHISL